MRWAIRLITTTMAITTTCLMLAMLHTTVLVAEDYRAMTRWHPAEIAAGKMTRAEGRQITRVARETVASRMSLGAASLLLALKGATTRELGEPGLPDTHPHQETATVIAATWRIVALVVITLSWLRALVSVLKNGFWRRSRSGTASLFLRRVGWPIMRRSTTCDGPSAICGVTTIGPSTTSGEPPQSNAGGTP